MDYGETEGVKSANRMEGSLKVDSDVGRRIFVYAGGGGGYDEIRKIDLRYEAGPGLGYHLVNQPRFQMNFESGANYQVQERSAGSDDQNVYARVAEDFTWKLAERLTATHRFEYFNNSNDLNEFRFRLDSTISYALWKNLSLNLTVLDMYDTDPAPNVNRNELLMRSSIGLTF